MFACIVVSNVIYFIFFQRGRKNKARDSKRIKDKKTKSRSSDKMRRKRTYRKDFPRLEDKSHKASTRTKKSRDSAPSKKRKISVHKIKGEDVKRRKKGHE